MSREERAEPIAIVGIACRFPGDAVSPRAFWDLLAGGVDAITAMPADRFDLDALFHPDPATPGAIYTRWGGFVHGIDQFDAGFFGISPREASRIDPQQRLLLETAWEAFEDAGATPERLAGADVGVFVGISTHDYGDIQMYPANRTLLDHHSNTGGTVSIAANRISYAFDLRGPSLTVDTACSSALTAVHLACSSLQRGECSVALAAGVQILLTPEPTMGFCRATMLSPTGRCRAFDAGADGYVRSEGVGVVMLKPLARALADRDRIHAVILGSAINQDGRTPGMTVPSAAAQAAMLRCALERAGVDAADVQYIEAHGTGTPVGDPIEAEAIGSVLGRRSGEPCALGSVKSNIGHLEAASGIAGLIKTTLALSHRQIPPSLHVESPNPAADLAGRGLRLVTALEPWPAEPGRATAGVNSFGFGGANAHVVLREAPRLAAAGTRGEGSASSRTAHLLTISARSEYSLRALAEDYLTLVSRPQEAPVAAFCAASARRRAHHGHRLAVVGATYEELADGLDAFLAGEVRAGVAAGRAPAAPPPLAFVFSGMGPQWWGMARRLIEEVPLVRDVIARCDAALDGLSGWSLLDELMAGEERSRVADADLAQVTGLAVQIALVELWKSWGIVPDAVIGHSAGEMAAAYAAGIHDLEQTVRLAYHRSRLQARATGKGRMLAAGVSPAVAEPWLARYGSRLSIAAINAPTSITLSGDAAVLDAVMAEVQGQKAFARLLPVAVPYHSAWMDPIRDELIRSLDGLDGRPASIGIVSEVTGAWAGGAEIDADYWWRNVREPVRFASGIQTLIAGGFRHFLEVGPHPVLGASIAECLAAERTTGTVIGSLRRMEDDRTSLLRAAAALYVHGRAMSFEALYPGVVEHVDLPTYRWERSRHWFEPKPADAWSLAAGPASGDPLLQHRLPSATPAWEARTSDARLAWLADHRVHGMAVFPGAAFIGMALAAGRALRPGQPIALERVEFRKALFLPAGEERRVQLTAGASALAFDVWGQAAGVPGAVDDARPWEHHVSGQYAASPGSPSRVIDMAALHARCDRELTPDDCYASLAARGLDYGPAFRGLVAVRQGDREALGTIRLPAEAPDDGTSAVHPALLDAAFQLLFVAAPDDGDSSALYLPVEAEEVFFHQHPGAEIHAHVRLQRMDRAQVAGDVCVFHADGRIALEVRGLICQRVDERAGRREETIADWLYTYGWTAKPPADSGRGTPAFGEQALDAVSRRQPDVDALSAATGWRAYYDTIEPALDSIARAHIAGAWRGLGLPLSAGARIAWEDVRARISPGRERLARRLMAILEDAGALAPAAGGWSVVAAPPETDDPLAADALIASAGAHAPALDLLLQCGRGLADNLAGRRPAADALFADDGLALVERFYRAAPASSYYNAVVADTLSALIGSSDGTSPLRVLEVGGGTGASTAVALEALQHRLAGYVFTDVSPVFVDGARVRWREAHGFSARLFDLERDPMAQGLAAGSFDVVIAANVVHATRDVRASLARLRTLLAPGGLLLLLEITRRPAWIDVIFGSTDGWWRFADRDLRPDHPLLDASTWTAVLEASGFDRVLAVADRDHPGEAGQAVLVARRAADPAVEADGRTAASTWLMLADRAGVGAMLAAELRALGAAVRVVHPGRCFRLFPDGSCELDPAKADDLRALLQDGDGIRGFLHLASLDAAEPAEDPAAFTAAQASSAHAIGRLALAISSVLTGRAAAPPELWMITAGAQHVDAADPAPALGQCAVWGLGRVLMKELPEIRCRIVDLDRSPDRYAAAALAMEIVNGDEEEEIAYRNGQRFVRRLQRMDPDATPVRPAAAVQGAPEWRAGIRTPGALQSIVFQELAPQPPGPGEVQLRIDAASVNFRDVMLALGMIPGLESETSFGHQHLGLDAAGTIVACGAGVAEFAPGDSVVGIVPGAFASSSITAADLVAHTPPALTAAEAAAVPCAFVTAHYALVHLARLAPGERVLIHAATGGVGMAALQIARRVGAVVFATAGSDGKRDWLAAQGVAHVFDSRSTEFAREILERTGGDGVDVVLNSLSGEALVHSLGLLRPSGRFLEIGKRDIYEDRRIGLLAFRKNLSFFAIDLDRLCAERPAFVGQLLREVMKDFADGRLAPPPYHGYPMAEVEHALRFMAQARHIGKIVLTSTDPPAPIVRDVSAGVRVAADGAYLITGGLGGFGLAVARWLHEHGAKRLVLMGRRGVPAHAEPILDDLRSSGAVVEVVQADVASRAEVREALRGIRRNGPLRGVVHAAMVLDDGAVAVMEEDRFERVMLPKMAGAWNLHLETTGDALDCFVLFSSIASLFGNPLQANYGAANAFLDALSHARRQAGLPSLTINWGVLAGVGYVARHADIAGYLDRQGYASFTPGQALEALGWLLQHDVAQAMAARVDWARWAAASPGSAASPRLRELVPAATGAPSAASPGGALAAALALADRRERLEFLTEHLRRKVAMTLGASPASIDVDRPISDLGTDSLTAVELTTAIDMDFGVELPAVKLLHGMSTSALAALVLDGISPAAVVALSGDAAPGSATGEAAAEVLGVPAPAGWLAALRERWRAQEGGR